jgi:hypothetical protein
MEIKQPPIFASAYLVEIRTDQRDGQEFWGVWGSGVVMELIEKRSHLIEQARRHNRPQNLGELIIVDEAEVAEHVYGYGEWK